jgi:hypothetical protein
MKHKKHLRKQQDGSGNDDEADDRAQVRNFNNWSSTFMTSHVFFGTTLGRIFNQAGNELK